MFNREFKKNVRGRVAGDDEAADERTAGRATCASCATPSSARCCSSTGDTLEPADFPIATAEGTATHAIGLPPQGLDLEETEKSLVLQALERTGWNQTRAAKLLGLNRDQIHYRIEKFKLAPAGPKP